MSKKRKLKSEDDEDDTLPVAKKRRVVDNKKKIKKQQERLESVYIVMCRKEDEATDRYEEVVDGYDKEIIAIYADRTKANEEAKEYFDEMNENGEIKGEVWDSDDKIQPNGLFKGYHHANNMGYSKHGAQLTNYYVWVERNTVLY
eukprot:540755_1